MRERVCKNCGGRQYVVVGQNMVKCQFCGTLYVDEHASKEEEVLTVGAYELLRELKFEAAVEEFDKILALYPLSFSALFGKSLATNKIVLYSNNKRGAVKKARFFGETATSISEDESFKLAVENAPPEIQKTYNDHAKKIDKLCSHYQQLQDAKWDVVVCAMDYNKHDPNPQIASAVEALHAKELSTYFVQDAEGREKEEEIFKALQTSKAFVLFANSKTGYANGEVKHLFDRYLYFAKNRKKTKSSFIVVLDDQVVSAKDLPSDLVTSKNTINLSSENFNEEFAKKVAKEAESSVKEVAKIDTVKIEKVSPKKKEYVDFESINPSDLGNYRVENISMSDANKIKWIYLSLKNGDFVTAKEFIDKEVEKDKYNAELLFAQLLCEYKLKTQEEFFSSVSYLRDKEKIDNILRYANKEFAEEFVDNWEALLMQLDNEEYYNAFLLYLAQYNSPKRDEFVTMAENKAVETMNDELIEKVLKCFRADEVERFVAFYFALAQKSDNNSYYQKVLEIDEGHQQSNLALLLQHFKTNQDKLTYRNKEEVEEVFKYLGEDTREQFVSIVSKMVLPVAFCNLEEAEKQLDFYLAYVSDEERLARLAEDIAKKFQEMQFFKQAEKYISIAISKDKNNAQLYWTLIEVKLHCVNDGELIQSGAKVTQLPEWETLMAVATEEETERFAGVISKINLYSGTKLKFEEDMLDKTAFKEKLREFVLRNNKIMLEMSKQEGPVVDRGISYYKQQLQPFEKYLDQVDDIEDYVKYKDLISKTNQRLELLDLTLESSVNVTKLTSRDSGLKNVVKSKQLRTEKYEQQKKEIKNDKFLKKFLFIFLELCPMAFLTILLAVVIVMPKEVYMYFNIEFLIGGLLVTTIISIVNLIIFLKKKNISKGWKFADLMLTILGGVNLVLFVIGFSFSTQVMSITNIKEFDTLLHNTGNYVTFELANDLDMAKVEWKSTNFAGKLDGKGHKLLNVRFAEGKNMSLFATNTGTIKNLEIHLVGMTYNTNCENFGAFASNNRGTIENCSVYGAVKLFVKSDASVGGLAATATAGTIKNCKSNAKIEIVSQKTDVNFGGLIGKVSTGKSKANITRNTVNTMLAINANLTNQVVYGGLVGYSEGENVEIVQNHTFVEISVTGIMNDCIVGGLFGFGSCATKDNYAQGVIHFDAYEVGGNLFVGGLYGQYQNSVVSRKVETSYTDVDIEGIVEFGKIVGSIGGHIENCFTTKSGTQKLFAVQESTWGGRLSNCLQLYTAKYDNSLGFDTGVWKIFDDKYPVLVWEYELSVK